MQIIILRNLTPLKQDMMVEKKSQEINSQFTIPCFKNIKFNLRIEFDYFNSSTIN